MNECKAKVLMIGPNLKAQGGISAVVQKYFIGGLSDLANVKYLSSTVDSNKLGKLIYAVWAYLKALFLIPSCDIAHVHMASRNSFKRKSIFIKYLYFLKKKVIIHLHGGEFDKFYLQECSKGYQKKIRNLFYKADKVIVLSSEWNEKIINIFGEEISKKTIVLHNSVDIPNYIPKDYSGNDIIFLGRLVEGKGIEDLLESMVVVIKAFSDAKLFICGEGNIEKYKQSCEKLKIQDCVKFLGWVSGEEKEKLLRNSSVFVLPSYNEGLPVSMLEAMSYGLACIVSRVGGIPSVIVDGVNGILIKPGDNKMLSDTICKLLDNKKMKQEIGEQAYLTVRDNFDICRNLEKLISIYIDLER